MTYIIRDREAGNFIDEVATIVEAKLIVDRYENEDRADGNFTDNFYEIYDTKLEEIINN